MSDIPETLIIYIYSFLGRLKNMAKITNKVLLSNSIVVFVFTLVCLVQNHVTFFKETLMLSNLIIAFVIFLALDTSIFFVKYIDLIIASNLNIVHDEKHLFISILRLKN
jgi:hypothetical protein